jgi:hypothetical protein
MLCTNCQQMNPDNAVVCEKCNSQLLEIRGVPPYQSRKLDKLVDAVKSIRSFQLSTGEFREILTSLKNSLEDTLDEVNSFDFPEDVAREMEQEIKMGSDGIKMFLEGINELFRYQENLDLTCLDRGLILAREGNNRLNEALKFNWENYQIMKDGVEEFLKSQMDN